MSDKICPVINKKCIKDECDFWDYNYKIDIEPMGPRGFEKKERIEKECKLKCK